MDYTAIDSDAAETQLLLRDVVDAEVVAYQHELNLRIAGQLAEGDPESVITKTAKAQLPGLAALVVEHRGRANRLAREAPTGDDGQMLPSFAHAIIEGKRQIMQKILGEKQSEHLAHTRGKERRERVLAIPADDPDAPTDADIERVKARIVNEHEPAIRNCESVVAVVAADLDALEALLPKPVEAEDLNIADVLAGAEANVTGNVSPIKQRKSKN